VQQGLGKEGAGVEEWELEREKVVRCRSSTGIRASVACFVMSSALAVVVTCLTLLAR